MVKSFVCDSFEIHSFLDFSSSDAMDVLRGASQAVVHSDVIGFAGYRDRSFLFHELKRFCLDGGGVNKFFSISKDTHDMIIGLSRESLDQLKPFSSSKKFLFLFPCFDSFTFEKMSGSGGFCPFDDVIIIFANPDAPGFFDFLKFSITHEFAHSCSSQYDGGGFTIGQGLVFEGVAEHFVEFMYPEYKTVYGRVISEAEAASIFRSSKPRLGSREWPDYSELFFGTGRFPNWTGYSMGYYLVEKYLKRKKVLIDSILTSDPQIILDEILTLL